MTDKDAEEGISMRKLSLPSALVALAVLLIIVAVLLWRQAKYPSANSSAPQLYHSEVVCEIGSVYQTRSVCEDQHWMLDVTIPGQRPLGEQYKVVIEQCNGKCE